MFRRIPNGCSRRKMARSCREVLSASEGKDDHDARLSTIGTVNHYVKLEEIENILFMITQKERKK